jgi:hypothetical protein
MLELVEMHSQFVSFYGPDMDGIPKWMEGEKHSKLMSMLQKIGIEDEGNDLSPLMPLYRYIYYKTHTCRTASSEICYSLIVQIYI